MTFSPNKLYYCSVVILLAIAYPLAYCETSRPEITSHNPLVELHGHVPFYTRTAQDMGPTPPATLVPNAVILFARSSEQQTVLQQFIYEQHDQQSASFHQWLSPEEFGKRFGTSDEAIRIVCEWLQKNGLQYRLSKGRSYIAFSATVGQLSKVFHISFHSFLVNGKSLYSPISEPWVPRNVADVIGSIGGLAQNDDRPAHQMAVADDNPAGPAGTGSEGNHYISPADFATIYDINPVYQAGYMGAGQSIAIVGRSRVEAADILNFAAATNLSLKPPLVVLPPKSVDPGETNDDDQVEATLDVTRASSVAPDATVYLVINAESNGGIDLPLEYIVDNQVAPIVSISFYGCEANAGQANTDFYDALFTQAAAEGITAFVSSGDGGVDSCETPNSVPMATQLASIDKRCASTNVTCVGGTQFNDTSNPSIYWSAKNSNGLESAVSYIPEGAFNQPVNTQTNSFQIFAGGGGISTFIAAPSWQQSLSTITMGYRAVPDISFSASGHDGYFICLGWEGYPCVPNSEGVTLLRTAAGTSASTPSMAGIQALVNEEQGGPAGAINATLYALASTPANNVFHDATVQTSGVTNCTVDIPSICNNSTPSASSLSGGAVGYALAPGFDLATGWGSIDVYKLLTNWNSAPALKPATIQLTLSQTVVTVGQSITFSATLYSAGVMPTGSVEFLLNGKTVGSPVPLVSGSSSLTIQAFGTTELNSVTALYSGDNIYEPGVSSVAQFLIIPQGTSTFSLTATPITIAKPGGSGTSTITITPIASFTGTVTFSCVTISGVVLGSCSFTPATVNLNGTPQIIQLTLKSDSPSTDTEVSKLSSNSSIHKESWNTIPEGGCILFFLILIAPARSAYKRISIVGVLVAFLDLTLISCSHTSPMVKLVTALNPATTQEQVMFQATVIGPQGAAVPTGQVQLFSNGQTVGAPQSLVSGTALLPQTFLKAGTFSMTAEYFGSGVYGYATSLPLSEVITFKNAGTLPGSYELVVQATSGSTLQSVPVSVTVQ